MTNKKCGYKIILVIRALKRVMWTELVWLRIGIGGELL
jgi:hypothetical protein